MKIDFTISSTLMGQRLDVVITRCVPSCSRSMAAAAISKGNIQVSGQRKRPGYRVKTADQISGEVQSEDTGIPVESDPRSLDVIHADTHVIVLNKPPGLVVHPGAGCSENTLVNRLVHHFPEIRQVGEDPLRPGIVHRLDRDTSGLILVARTAHSLVFLQKEFKYHRVRKTYLALVTGSDLTESGEICRPIGRHPRQRKRMCVNPDTGRTARTSWQVLQRYADACLVRIRLYTGRTHQIRVHFYDMGHPVVGDTTYQFRRNRKGPQSHPRQMLHAWRIEFRHPYSGVKMWFEADPPEDFISAITRESGASLADGISLWNSIMPDRLTDKEATALSAPPGPPGAIRR
jgi:23S rRNA pseudouridine1911/1915/1917 synthase